MNWKTMLRKNASPKKECWKKKSVLDEEVPHDLSPFYLVDVNNWGSKEYAAFQKLDKDRKSIKDLCIQDRNSFHVFLYSLWAKRFVSVR